MRECDRLCRLGKCNGLAHVLMIFYVLAFSAIIVHADMRNQVLRRCPESRSGSKKRGGKEQVGVTAIQAYHSMFKAENVELLVKSPRYQRTLASPSSNFCKAVAGLPRRHTPLLTPTQAFPR